MKRESAPAILASILRARRSDAGLSLRALAEKSGIPHSFISNIENARRPVGQKAAAKLAVALGLAGLKRDQFLLAAAAAQNSDVYKVCRKAMRRASKVFVVMKVDYDGYRLGRCWEMKVAATQEVADRLVKEFTKPVNYYDGPRKYEPHTHRQGGFDIAGYVGPQPMFVYVQELEVQG